VQLSKFVLALAAVAFAAPASAIVFSEHAFKSGGGNLSDIDGTINAAFAAHVEAADADPFFATGRIGDCSATWLGDIDGEAWFLTAAHCLPAGSAAQPVTLSFTDWKGRVTASGHGWRHLPPERVTPPAGAAPGASDIALVQLPRVQVLVDAHGMPVQAPRIDGTAATSKPVSFVGYGTWGVGRHLDTRWSNNGVRRVLGRSVIDATRDAGHTLVANYIATSATSRTSRVADGDDGAAWWQYLDGQWRIVGVTHGFDATRSYATHIDAHVDWIRATMPGVQTPVHSHALTELAPLDIPAVQGRYTLAPNQTGVSMSSGEFLTAPGQHERVTLRTIDQVTRQAKDIVLRATRQPGQPLRFAWHDEDNAALASGAYRGTFTVDGRDGPFLRERFEVAVDVVHGVRAKVLRNAEYRSPDMALAVSNSTVYFLVPSTQAGASGPTSGAWSQTDWKSTIVVKTVNAETGLTVPVNLRGTRFTSCPNHFAINNGISMVGCGNQYSSTLRVVFLSDENPGLPRGLYRGIAYIEARGWHKPLREVFAIEVEIDTR
jgi:hypothetical protein